MGSSIMLTDPASLLVADASTVINFIATGSAREIIAALPNRVAVVDVVPAELETGRARGRQACDRLKELTSLGLVHVVALDDSAMPYFEDLVIGTAVSTLDDGEAATIAYALTHAGTALIDERKATRICRERFPALEVATTIDVLIHGDVQQHLGQALLADTVFRALRDGKMSVLPHHIAWVVGLIGDERAALCPSLPRRARRSSPAVERTEM